MSERSPCPLGFLPGVGCVDCPHLDDCGYEALPPNEETPEDLLRATWPEGSTVRRPDAL